MTEDAAFDVAEFDDVLDWTAGALPDAVVQKARLLWLDSLGCIAAGLRHDEVQRLGAALGVWFPGDIRLSGSATALGPAGAAALGAAAMCWDEANEGLAAAHGRPALPIVPALLALGGPVPSAATLHAFVTGYEVGGRAGELWRIRPGMHVDGAWHALGAAAACAIVTGADPARAIRVAACQIPFSLYAPIAAGMSGRNSYPAHAALLGLLAACASAAGSDAPAGGFAEARTLALGHAGPGARTPGGHWLIRDGYLKPYAAVRHAHYAVAAALSLRRDIPDVAGITAIRLETYAEAIRYAGNRAPSAAIAAQFSLSFATAAALRHGRLDPDIYRMMDDPELRRLEALVELAVDPALTGRAARLTVSTPLGVTSAFIDAVPGDAARPMTAVEVEAKFMRLAGHLPDAAALADAILRA